MSSRVLDTKSTPESTEPGDVARALHGLSDTVFLSIARLTDRCECAERELEILRSGAGSPAGERAALEARIHELERLLATVERLARIGTMASGIGHEIQNPLHVARGFAELLERHAGRDGHERRWAARIVDCLEEVEVITTSLLSNASRHPASRDTVDPDELVASAIASARRVIEGRGAAERWTITKHVDSPQFAGDRIKLRSALRNLVAHALQALPAGGRVEVRTRLDGGEIEIAVHDSGLGVPALSRRRLDEPNFTSHGNGSGLGLVLARAIAELHGGRLEVSTNPGPLGGAVTLLRLPFEPR